MILKHPKKRKRENVFKFFTFSKIFESVELSTAFGGKEEMGVVGAPPRVGPTLSWASPRTHVVIKLLL